MINKRTFLLSFGINILVVSLAIGQRISIPGEEIICYASDETHKVRIEAPIPDGALNTARIEAENPFVVTYSNVSTAERRTIERATEIWSQVIRSDQPIKISIGYTQLSEGVLGSARATSYEANFEGAPKRNIAYPIALAERLARKELNDSTDFEIIINLNIVFTWHVEYDQPISDGKHDLLSVVLHEIGHGLGLADSFRASGNSASWDAIERANIYDYYIYNFGGEQIITDIKNNSNDLFVQLTSNRLMFNADLAKKANNDIPPKVYAPTEFSGGSSISHLDEATFPAGDTNSLMSPQIGREEVIHDQGPIINAILAEMGYVYTFIEHDSVPDVASEFEDVIVTGSIEADSTINAEESYLVYSFDDFETINKVNIVLDGNNFNATIPAPGIRTMTSYYFEFKDVNNLIFKNPAESARSNYEFGYGIITSVNDDMASRDISIFPNPTTGVININGLDNVNQAVISITDVSGKLVHQDAIQGNQTLNPGLQEGVYIVSIQSGNASFASRLVVK